MTPLRIAMTDQDLTFEFSKLYEHYSWSSIEIALNLYLIDVATEQLFAVSS